MTPPLSLAYLAAVLQREGFEVDIIDFLVSRYRPEKLRRKLEQFRPHIVGATCVTITYQVAARMLKACKDFDPHIVTAIGGPHVSFTVEETFRRAPWIDVIAIGEGDDTIVDLARTVEGGGHIGEVPGIAFREGDAVVRTEPRPFIQDLDELPVPARHLLSMSRYIALGSACTMITSRGCPYSCIFCSANGMFGRKVRFRDPGLVVDELEMLHRDYDFVQINIVDDTFTVNHNHVREVCEEVIRRNLKPVWSAYARVDTMSDDVAELMKSAGCKWVMFGVESGNEGILKTVKKGITREKVRSGVQIATNAGLRVFNSFIFGLPGETPETAQESMEFAEELANDCGAGYGFHILAPMPGTPLYDRADEYGIRLLTRDWSRHDANQIITELPTMSVEMMREVVGCYEDHVATAQEDVRHQAEAGDEECVAMVKGKEKQDFVWELIKGDVIEGLGRISAAVSGDHHGARVLLTRQVADHIRRQSESVEEQLGNLVARGLLRLESSGDGLRWRWGDGRRLETA